MGILLFLLGIVIFLVTVGTLGLIPTVILAVALVVGGFALLLAGILRAAAASSDFEAAQRAASYPIGERWTEEDQLQYEQAYRKPYDQETDEGGRPTP